MQAALAVESRDFALDLHTLLGDLDTARWKAELEQAVRDRATRLETRAAELREAIDDANLRESLDEVVAVLRAALPDAGAPAERLEAEWSAFRARLQPAYEAWANALLEHAIHVPTRRPTNYARSILHALAAAAAVVVIHFVLGPTAMLVIGAALAVWAWSMEIGRRVSPAINQLLMRIFGSFAHPHEAYRINSATWYCTALLALGLTGSTLLAMIAIAVLGFADPMAAFVGRRWGSIKLVNGRSLQGTLAFFATGTIAALVVTTATQPDIPPLTAVGLSAAASALAAVAELFSLRVDDNLSVPLAAAAGAALGAFALGMAL